MGGADPAANTITKLSKVGKLLANWKVPGDSSKGHASDAAIGPDGVVYVADTDGNKIQRWKLDDHGPHTTAKAVSVVKGKTATFTFSVDEDLDAQVSVSIQIKKGSVVKKTIPLGMIKPGAALSAKWKCSLPKGTYKYYVLAVDSAGNNQSPTGSAKLTVK